MSLLSGRDCNDPFRSSSERLVKLVALCPLAPAGKLGATTEHPPDVPFWGVRCPFKIGPLPAKDLGRGGTTGCRRPGSSRPVGLRPDPSWPPSQRTIHGPSSRGHRHLRSDYGDSG